jgi:hypothetical protein
MKIDDFESLVSDLVDDKITLHILKDQTAKKWYDKEYARAKDEILDDTIYGVCIDSGTIDFDFKTGKNKDSLLKTFISQYSSKVCKYDLVDGQVQRLNKKQVLDKIVKHNDHRVHKGLFYTTLYGIGMWDFFNSDMVHNILHKEIDAFLKANEVKYTNEYSDARWVFRYKFNMDIENTNQLLSKFNMQ